MGVDCGVVLEWRLHNHSTTSFSKLKKLWSGRGHCGVIVNCGVVAV